MWMSIKDIFEAPLRSSMKSMELAPNFIFFVEFSNLELLELDVFGNDFVERSWKSWSGVLPNRL